MKLPAEIADRLPEPCRQCPVFLRMLFVGDQYARLANQYTDEGLELLDTQPAQSPEVSAFREQMARRYGTWALEHTATSDTYFARLEAMIGAAREGNCHGSSRGAQTKATTLINRIMAYITGERSCNNPEFNQFAEDTLIGPQLAMGNWVKPE